MGSAFTPTSSAQHVSEDLPTAATSTTTSAQPPPDSANSRPRFLVFHLDGVSSNVFMDELAAGRLETIRRWFGVEGIIPRAVTLFPPITSVVVSRVRHGHAADQGRIVDWSGYDRISGSSSSQLRIFLEYIRSIPRRGRSTAFYGVPLMDRFGELAMWNLPDMVERYGYVEFYWFGTDTAGHRWGENAQRRSLRRFDRSLGRALDRLPDDTNVIVYSDHGMVFGEVANHDAAVLRVLGESALHYAYPNIYLRDPSARHSVAERVVMETTQDFAFVLDAPDRLQGRSRHGTFWFERDGNLIRYLNDGNDALGYSALGYDGAWLTPGEWLVLTHEARYPYTPVRMFELFDNPNTGDVVVVLNDPKVKIGAWSTAGNHHGISALEMTVPLLVRGPDVAKFYGRPAVPIEAVLASASLDSLPPRRPGRETHLIRLWSPTRDGRPARMEVAVSPWYRTRIGIEVSGDDSIQGRGLVDLASGYLSRIWAGAGLVHTEGSTRLAVLGEYGFRVHRIGLDLRFSSAEAPRVEVFLRVGRWAEIRTRGLESAGIGLRF